MAIKVFFEGGNVMIGATKEECDVLNNEGVKLKLNPDRAHALKEALEDRLMEEAAMERINDGTGNGDDITTIRDSVNIQDV